MPSKIEWTEETWNPTVGCSKVSPGCDSCYAIRQAVRLQRRPEYAKTVYRSEGGLNWTGLVRCLPERLDIPLHRRTPTAYFVDSMSDLFHPDVPPAFIAQVFEVMVSARQHTFQVLTKRPQWMRALLNERYATPEEVDAGYELGLVPGLWDQVASGVPASNVWLGTSIENDTYAFRANHLRATPAAVRFLSLEPLLGPLPSLDLADIDWVIVGGESGPNARAMHPRWVRDIRDRCAEAGVPFFFKQWGAWRPYDASDGIGGRTALWDGLADEDELVSMVHVGGKAGGRELDGRTWDEMPERAA